MLGETGSESTFGGRTSSPGPQGAQPVRTRLSRCGDLNAPCSAGAIERGGFF